MRSIEFPCIVGLWTLGLLLSGCFDLDAARPECFADDPCANGAACVQGRCGEPPTRSVTLDISRCADGVECAARWSDATLCGVVLVDGQTARGTLNGSNGTMDLALPLGASSVQAVVFAQESGSCEGLSVDAACGDDCTVAWGFPAQDVPEGPITLTAQCDDVRWAEAPPEVCNLADDDCDGVADEAVPAMGTCDDGLGACRREATLECVEGSPLCGAIAGMPGDEIEDDEIDNDCDGIIDEVPPTCPPGAALACQTDCAMGTRQCSDAGVAGPCLDAEGEPLPEPTDELCNGADDDCDGSTDEGYGLGVVCNLGAPGCPAQGLTACDGADETQCAGDIPNGLMERCDGLDNDCDGTVDNGFDVGEGCVVGVGVCRREGTQVCDAGGEVTVCEGEAGAPSIEACNGLDDDCDDVIDEGQGVGMPCTRGEGACAESGLFVCELDGSVICDAPDPRPLLEEACDGADNDCDEAIDEGFGVGDACLRGEDACAEAGVIVCDDAGGAICNAAEPVDPIDETCNGVDDDCDAIVDEGLGLGDACVRGEGPCNEQGTIVCDAQNAAVCDAAEPQVFEDEVCDGADNDCDDIIDEGFDFDGLAHCGGCDQACAVPNAQNVCAERICVADACAEGFVDLNGDLAQGDAGDGCECVVLGVDTPDVDGVDADCDGIDGAIVASIFVDPLAGDGANAGTPDAPVATLAEALALVDGQRRWVLLSVGVHPVIAPQDVPGGVHIHGGYGGVAESWRRVPRDEGVTALQGPATVLRYTDLASATTLDRVDVTTPDSGADVSTIAIIATNVDVHLTLQAVHVRPGRGGDGAAGVDGQPAADGLQAPSPGVGPNGGEAGANLDCVDLSAGGAGASVFDGAGQDAPGGATGGPNGAAGEDGTPGEPGDRGLDGAEGIGASAFGAIVNGRWRLTYGTDGQPGTPGEGGGGGGAGGMEVGPIGPFRQGGGGGGGGAGACAGFGGGRGGSGGASIALMVHGGQVRAIDCEFAANLGGAGGVAGLGSPGAAGGAGANGEPEDCGGACGAGGPGGDGGDGGCGGPGGGGAGGPSIAVLGVGPVTPVRFEDVDGVPTDPVISVSAPGSAGDGGAGCGVPGGAGAAGVALPIGCCILGGDGSTCATLLPCDEVN